MKVDDLKFMFEKHLVIGKGWHGLVEISVPRDKFSPLKFSEHF